MYNIRHVNIAIVLAMLIQASIAHGLTIKINSDKEISEEQAKKGTYYSYYLITTSDEILPNLSLLETYSSDEFLIINKDENTTSFPKDMSQRMFKVLSEGWSYEIVFTPEPSAPEACNSIVAPCTSVMFYIAFGVTDYKKQVDISSFQLLKHHKKEITNVGQHLQIGDVVCIANDDTRYNNETVIYLGNDLFLSWERGRAAFYIRSSSQLAKAYRDPVSIFHAVKKVRSAMHFMPILLPQHSTTKMNQTSSSEKSDLQYQRNPLPIPSYSYVK